MAQSTKHQVFLKMDAGVELFSTVRLSLGALLHFQLRICAGAPYGCASSARTVRGVLQSVSIGFVSPCTSRMNSDCL